MLGLYCITVCDFYHPVLNLTPDTSNGSFKEWIYFEIKLNKM